MVNISVEFPNNRLIMRPIKKRPQSAPPRQLDAIAALTCGASSSLLGSQTIFTFDQASALEIDHLKYENAITTSMLLRPCMWLNNTLVAKSFKMHLPKEHVKTCEINGFAVRLDDIEPWWQATQLDHDTFSSQHPASRKVVRKQYDDVDLDFFAIQREAEKYNDCSDLHRKLDLFFTSSMKQRLVLYMSQLAPHLSRFQRLILCDLIHNKSPNVFDQLTWFGYDCVLTVFDVEPMQVTQYENIVNSILGTKSCNSSEDMVIDFGINSCHGTLVADLCDKHFTRTVRKRMPYTKKFGKSTDA